MSDLHKNLNTPSEFSEKEATLNEVSASQDKQPEQ